MNSIEKKLIQMTPFRFSFIAFTFAGFLSSCSWRIESRNEDKNNPVPNLNSGKIQGPAKAKNNVPGDDSQSAISGSEVRGRWNIAVDLNDPVFSGTNLEPSSQPVTLSPIFEKELPPIRLRAMVKRFEKQPDRIWMDLIIENKLSDGMIEGIDLQVTEPQNQNLKGALDPSAEVINVTDNPFSTEAGRKFEVTRIGENGLYQLSLSFPKSQLSSLSFELSLTGKVAPVRHSTNSKTIAIADHAREVWAAFPEFDGFGIYSTQNGNKEVFAKGGRPHSVSISPDENVAAVVYGAANKLEIYDRASRQLLQSFGEESGIGRDLRHVVFSPDGQWLITGAYVTGTVSFFRKLDGQFVLQKTVNGGRFPSHLNITLDSGTLWVSHFLPRGNIRNNETWYSSFDIASQSPLKELVLRDRFGKGNTECSVQYYQTPFFKKLLGDVGNDDLEVESAYTQATGLFWDANETRAWMPGTKAAGFVFEWGKGKDPELDGLIKFKPGDINFAFLTLSSLNSKGKLDFQIQNAFERDAPLPYSNCMEFEKSIDFTTPERRAAFPQQYVNRLTQIAASSAGLSEIGLINQVEFTRGGRRALILSKMSDEIAVHDATTLFPSSVKHLKLSGSNPSGMVVSKTANKAFVAFENTPEISVVNLSGLGEELPNPQTLSYWFEYAADLPPLTGPFGSDKEKVLIRQVPENQVGTPLAEEKLIRFELNDPMSASMRRGRVLFESSNPEKVSITASRSGTCASCHPGGGTDGSGWGTMEGERRTTALWGGVANRGWLHAKATHSDALEFVQTIAPERLGGNSSTEDFNSLAEYLAFGIPKLQNLPVDAKLAEKGAEVFKAACASCHSGVEGGSGNADPSNKWKGGSTTYQPVLFDVGTANTQAFITLPRIFDRLLPGKKGLLFKTLRGERAVGQGDIAQSLLDFRQRPDRAMGQFKAPTLTNVALLPLFLHDGSKGTLDEVVDLMAQFAPGGLDTEKKRAVSEYLKTL